MRILFLDHTGMLGGAELSLLDIARHFRAEGRVLLFGDGPFRGRLQEAGVAVTVEPAGEALQRVRRDGGPAAALRSAPAVLRLARRVAAEARTCDVLYANSQKSLVIAALAARRTGRPLVWHLRDLLTPEHVSGLNRRTAVALANTSAKLVIGNSAATAAAFVAAGGRRSLAAVVHNGIDPRPFDDAVADSGGAAVPPGAPVVGVFGRLAPWKGQHVLLDALPRLPGVHALVVGDALFGEEAYAERLRARARELGVAARTHFLGFRGDVPALMKACDVVVHTSTSPEPFGRVLVEAMLAGRPVVASAAGGALEVVEDGVSGLLAPPGSSVALAAVVERLLGDPCLRRRLRRAGRQRALERFALAPMCALIERHLRDLAPPRGGGTALRSARPPRG